MLLDHIVAVMGKGENSSSFKNLVKFTNEEGNVFSDTAHARAYQFFQSGFTLFFMKKVNCFAYAFIGSNMNFAGNLPAEIAWGDEPQAVEQKTQQRPFESKLVAESVGGPKDLAESYFYAPCRFEYYYSWKTFGLNGLNIIYKKSGKEDIKEDTSRFETRKFWKTQSEHSN